MREVCAVKVKGTSLDIPAIAYKLTEIMPAHVIGVYFIVFSRVELHCCYSTSIAVCG